MALAGALLAYDILEGAGATAALAAAALFALTFVGQVVLHRRVRGWVRWHEALAGVEREGLLRLERRWNDLDEALPPAEREHAAPEVEHPYARDLDVLGPASLVRLAGPVTSERGRALLRGWLLVPGTADDARARRGAVRELAPSAELRGELVAQGRLRRPDRQPGLSTFLAWAESEPILLGRRGLRVAAWVVPILTLAGLVADVALGLPPWWLVPALVQVAIYRRVAAAAGGSLERAATGAGALRAMVPQLALLEAWPCSDSRLTTLKRRLGGGSGSATARLSRLSRLLDTVESRRNSVYAALALLILLDLHLALALDRWRTSSGGRTRAWIDTLAEWEALSALATLAYDHPDWAMPEFGGPGAPLVTAQGLGHPLLPQEECVRNDVTVGPPGSFLLVTGSNMSGKSTLLRALGANVVLASAGAPVCASALSLPPLRVHTSMRIDDSLAAGVSLFMAELLRIRQVVDAASAPDPHGRPVLYLLDEILHGTNTAERRVAARGVVRHLLASGAIGAVSTHDLTLAEAPDLQRAAHAVHFRETVDSADEGSAAPRLTFDYRLREGIATTRNAIKLLRAVGLGGLELEEDVEADRPRQAGKAPDAPDGPPRSDA
jgi:hypothetical protein